MSAVAPRAEPWWRGAVVYQIYIRSFFDADGDGRGDLAGIASKLGYLSSLGVDALWLSPVHPSPNRDWGYDVADYNAVHADYGTAEDFAALVAAAHRAGLKVLLDEVLSHTSDEHPWFRDSLRKGAKSDWYVWADPRDDGTAPNNWLSAFGGPAWAYHPARRQYYHHKFLRQQPKLNWHNAEARAAALEVLDYWLARGVDGFRLDVANTFLHDPALGDNPPVPPGERTAHHWAHAPNLQRHLHDANLTANLGVLDEIRRRVERHAGRYVFGEFSEEAERSGCYAAPDEGLHSGYSFPLLDARRLEAGFIRRHYDGLARHSRHWPSIAFSNHDVIRTVTRFGGRETTAGERAALAKLMLGALLSLRGTILLYQGEELGLPEADLARHELRDPVGDLYYPFHKGRDGCRTPMPWNSQGPGLGFTAGTPWLPFSPEHAGLAANLQAADAASPLAFARAMIAARKASMALRLGGIDFMDTAEPVLAFVRDVPGEAVLCVFNMSGSPAGYSDPRLARAERYGPESGAAARDGTALALGPYALRLFRL